MSIDIGCHMCPDLFETDHPIPGDEVSNVGIDIFDILWNLSDVFPAGCPDSISELFEEEALGL